LFSFLLFSFLFLFFLLCGRTLGIFVVRYWL
jgi:hypothetical protein